MPAIFGLPLGTTQDGLSFAGALASTDVLPYYQAGTILVMAAANGINQPNASRVSGLGAVWETAGKAYGAGTWKARADMCIGRVFRPAISNAVAISDGGTVRYIFAFVPTRGRPVGSTIFGSYQVVLLDGQAGGAKTIGPITSLYKGIAVCSYGMAEGHGHTPSGWTNIYCVEVGDGYGFCYKQVGAGESVSATFASATYSTAAVMGIFH